MDINLIRKKISSNKYDLSEHAHRERQEEQITVEEIEQIILEGDIIEQYPNDPRGRSCLVAGKVTGRSLHIVCGMRSDRLLVVTVYRPKLPTWKDSKPEQRSLKAVSKCYFCRGKTEVKNVDIDFRWGGRLFVVRNVPVEICSQCGERYYSAETSKKLDELAKKQATKEIKPQKTIEVPIYNW